MDMAGRDAVASVIDLLEREHVPSFIVEVADEPGLAGAVRAVVRLRVSETHRATVRWQPGHGYDVWRGDAPAPAMEAGRSAEGAARHLAIALLRSPPGHSIADHLLRELEIVDADPDHPVHATAERGVAAILRDNGLGEPDIRRILGERFEHVEADCRSAEASDGSAGGDPGIARDPRVCLVADLPPIPAEDEARFLDTFLAWHGGGGEELGETAEDLDELFAFLRDHEAERFVAGRVREGNAVADPVAGDGSVPLPAHDQVAGNEPPTRDLPDDDHRPAKDLLAAGLRDVAPGQHGGERTDLASLGCEITDLAPVSRTALTLAVSVRAERGGVGEEPGEPAEVADAFDRLLDSRAAT